MTVQECLQQTENLQLELQQKLIQAVKNETLTHENLLSSLKEFALQLQQLNAKLFSEVIENAQSVDELQETIEALRIQTKLMQQVNDANSTDCRNTYLLQSWLLGILNIFALDSRVENYSFAESINNSSISLTSFKKENIDQIMTCAGLRCG